MYFNPSRRLIRSTALIVPAAVLLAACSSKEEVVQQPPPVVEVVVTPTPEARDALGSYRFNMSDGEQKMTADQFDAWMKANGIRVAKGNDGPLEPVVVATKDEPGEQKPKKK